MKLLKLFKEIDKVKPNELSSEQIKTCFKIISAMSKEPKSLKEIGQAVGIPASKVKQNIYLIRREMVTKFQNPTGRYYIVNNREGYYMISDKKEVLEKYKEVIKKKYNDIYNQLLQIELAILNNND